VWQRTKRLRVFVFQALTVESNSWTTPLVLRLLSSGNVSERYCWNGSMLIASGSLSNWSVTVDRPWGPWCYCNKPSSARAGLLSDRAGLLTRFLTVQAGLLTHFLTVQAGLLTHFITVQAGLLTCFLTVQAGLLTCFLTLTSFKSGWQVYNPVERLTNRSTANNRAVTYSVYVCYHHYGEIVAAVVVMNVYLTCI